MRRPCRDALFATVTIVALVVATCPPETAFAAPCWRPPVVGEVVDPFRAPDCPYCAGNRGVEVRPVAGAEVIRAVEAGEVTFSGSVAGTIYVVIEHANGWKVTYGRLGSSDVRRGQRVAGGARLGTADGDVYFGLRVNGEYRDPEPFLAEPTGRPRLVPVDGTEPRAVASPRWTCRT